VQVLSLILDGLKGFIPKGDYAFMSFGLFATLSSNQKVSAHPTDKSLEDLG